MLILAALAGVMLLLCGVSLLTHKNPGVKFTPSAIGFTCLAVSSLISLVACSTNKIEALMNPLGALTYISLAILIAFLAGRRIHRYVILLISGIALTLASLHIYQMFTSPIMPLAVAWTVTRETFTTMKTTLLGVGTENFFTAFTMGRPSWIAQTDLWNTRFSVSANFFLHQMVTNGIMGVVTATVFALSLFVGALKKDIFLFVKILSVAALLLTPPTVITMAFIACVCILSTNHHDHSTASTIKPGSQTPLTFVCFALGILLLLGTGLISYGELMYGRALSAARKDSGTEAYNLLVGALKVNPYPTKYHMTYSLVSIALANSVAGELKTDEDQRLIEKLIDQAIREAKIAVQLNDHSVLAWENLSSVYQRLIAIAQGADAWAVASYQKTIELDPHNPTLFLNLGAIFIHQKKYEEAIVAFEKAIALRPTYANAYYNLANTYRLQGDTVKAATILEQAIRLVPPESSDYYKTKNELDALKNPTPPTLPQ